VTALAPLAPIVAAILRSAAVLPDDDTPYLVLMVAGFVVGILGHVFRVRLMVAVGIAMIFLATLLLPIALNLFSDREEPTGPGAPA
jgi:hypothetical protein